MYQNHYRHQSILAVDITGTPRRWITVEEAISYHATDSVAWSLGELGARYHGGIQHSGDQSVIETKNIIAIRGKHFERRLSTVCLTNRTLFGRDRYLCAYCGRQFDWRKLSRDHIVPRSRGGTNSWTNVVTACTTCNSYKGSRTLREAGLELLYVPYVPSHSENMILQNRNILADQMDYLKAQLPRTSRIWHSL